MTKSNNLVIGLGQIGSAIHEILGCDGIDVLKPKSDLAAHYDVLHICFPYSEKFVDSVEEYKKRFTPSLVIIHSTVQIGTSSKLGAVHSPVRGIHPNLKEGILTFVKFFGSDDPAAAEKAANIFKEKGIKTLVAKSSNDTEAMKLWDTTQYGWNIALEKFIWHFCKVNGLDFDIVYTEANKSYNEGYEKLGLPQYKKYILKHIEGKIGGHCVKQNLTLINGKIAEIINEIEEQFAEQKPAPKTFTRV